MKKIIVIIAVAALLAAMLAPAASASGILFSDDFESGEMNVVDWFMRGSLFYAEQGGPTHSWHAEGWAEAVVQQTSWSDYTPAPRVYGPNFAVKCDTWFFSDGGGHNGDIHWVGLWWADHFQDTINGERITYCLKVVHETRSVELVASGEGAGQEFFPADTVVAKWDLPDDEPLVMDESEPTVFSLGLRINGTQIDGFYNNEKVISYTAPRMGTTECPILFWNHGNWTGFDNFIVSTADYDLFDEGASAVPADNTPSEGEPANEPEPTEKVIETKVETKVVEDTDENGEIVTRIETEIVTEEVVRPAPETQGNTTGGGGGTSARTGDSAIIVAAVMIAALGAAVVVKKVYSK